MNSKQRVYSEEWLESNMAGVYQQLQETKNDVLNAMANFQHLLPRAKKFTYDEGSLENLVCLEGTIPVPVIHKDEDKTCNIPIQIWLQSSHPVAPPHCFVKPNGAMQLHKGKYVDANGKIFLPFFADWTPGKHDLTGCIQVMRTLFSQELPIDGCEDAVFSRPEMPCSSKDFADNKALPYPEKPVAAAFCKTPPDAVGENAMSVGPAIHQHVQVDGAASSSGAFSDTGTHVDAEMQSLLQTRSVLRVRQKQLDSVLVALKEEILKANTSTEFLQTECLEQEKELERSKNLDKFDADDAVKATTPLYRQIVNLFAEEQAIEDTIYYLGEALHKSVLDTDTYLKHVRALSRQQFTLRALIQKTRKSAVWENTY